jgi:uncharacterized membrane protein SirB2
MIRSLHVALAYVTVIGFVLRALLRFSQSPLLEQKWLRIAPHVIDTLLLLAGITLAVQLAISPLEQGWLAAKIVGLVIYIGFGVMTMRATTASGRTIGFIGALAAVAYIFAVAYTKQVVPF